MSLLTLGTACSSLPSRRLAEAPARPITWVELGPDSAVIARAITGEKDCPKIEVDAEPRRAMSLRAEPNAQFPVRVCEAQIPRGAKTASIDGHALPLPVANPKRVLFMGDTGCRIEYEDGTTDTQNCNDPRAWPFPTISHNGAKLEPDLIVHVGDYHYRESPCPPEVEGCAGSPHGYGWLPWHVDFFEAAGPLLKAAPWVFVRGNHEDCKRAGEGWFRFLDPRPLDHSQCPVDTAPYEIKQGDVQLVVMDTSTAPDLKLSQDRISVFRSQFDKISAMPLQGAWLVTHKPMWAPVVEKKDDPKSPLRSFNLTLQTASKNKLPQGIEMAFGGHLHVFEELHFADKRPMQIVVGNGGSSLYPAAFKDPAGIPIAGTHLTSGNAINDFGVFLMESDGPGLWHATVYDVDLKPVLRCGGKGRDLRCLPQ